MNKITGFAVAVVVTVFLPLSVAQAAGETTAQTKSACSKQYEQCQQTCNKDHPDVAPDRIACITTCSAKFAACDAGVAFEKAKPWIEEQSRKTQKFFEDLLGSGEGGTPPPQSKTDENSI